MKLHSWENGVYTYWDVKDNLKVHLEVCAKRNKDSQELSFRQLGVRGLLVNQVEMIVS